MIHKEAFRHKYLIGEASRLTGVTEKALRHYDKLGLVEPDEVGDNGYRYYSLETMLKIPVINYLKMMGFSLEEITDIITCNSIGKIRGKFFEREEIYHQEELELHERMQVIQDWMELIDEANFVRSYPTDEVSVRYVPAEDLLAMPYHFKGNYADAIINLEFSDFVAKHNNVITGPVIMRHDCIWGCAVERCLEVGCPVTMLQKALRPIDKDIHVLRPGGMYLSSYHVGDFNKMPYTFDRMMRYAQDNNYDLENMFYERFVVDYWTTFQRWKSHPRCRSPELVQRLN